MKMETKNSLWIFGLWFIFSGIVVYIWWSIGGWAMAVSVNEQKFESLNSLFSGLAFVGMLCTLYMQRLELRSTRKEMEETKIETRRLADATAKSAAIETKKHRLDKIDLLLKEKRDANLAMEIRIGRIKEQRITNRVFPTNNISAEDILINIDDLIKKQKELSVEINQLENERQTILVETQ